MARDPTLLELEVVDVVLVEHGRRAEQDLALGADRAAAQLAGGEGLAFLAGDRARRERGRGVAGELAELTRIPQLEGLNRAVLDELAHLVRVPSPVSATLPLYVGA